MNIFLTLAFLFFIGATLGWVLELLFRTAKVGMEKADEWANSDDSPKEEKKPEGQE